MSRYIDADKLKEHYMWWGGGFTANCKDGQKEVKKIFDEIIDLQPTADVRENVKGRWVEVVDRTEMYDKEGVKTWGMLFQCNQCGFVLNAVEGHTDQYNFCPNCGADMRGES